MLPPDTKMMYRSDPYRFVVLVIFCVFCVFIGLFMNPYAPVANSLHLAYGITVPQIISTMICFLVGKIVSAPISGALLETIGLKPGIYIALVLMTFGLFLRTQMEVSFALVLVAQFLLGLAAAVVVSSQLKFLYEWYHPATRGYFTTIVSFSFILGGGVGLIFILLFVKDTETDPEAVKVQVGWFDKINLICVLFLTIIHTIFFLSKPRKGYGYQEILPGMVIPEHDEVIATESENDTSLSIRDQVRLLFGQPAFRLFMGMYVLVNGVNLLNASVLTIIYEEFGVKSYRKALIVIATMLAGVIGSMNFIRVFMPSPDSRSHFTKFLVASFVFSVLNAVCFIIEMPYFVILLVQCGFGATFFMGLPVTIEYMLRNVKHVPLTLVNGLIFFFGQSFACILLLINRAIFSWLEERRRTAIYFSWTLSCGIQLLFVALSTKRKDIGSNWGNKVGN